VQGLDGVVRANPVKGRHIAETCRRRGFVRRKTAVAKRRGNKPIVNIARHYMVGCAHGFGWMRDVRAASYRSQDRVAQMIHFCDKYMTCTWSAAYADEP